MVEEINDPDYVFDGENTYTKEEYINVIYPKHKLKARAYHYKFRLFTNGRKY
jgi:hypothetical protein